MADKTHAEGILMLPPISVPTPIEAPWKANNADSPPLLPPEARSLLYGLTVRPQRLLKVSPIMSVWPTLVLHSTMAPALRTNKWSAKIVPFDRS